MTEVERQDGMQDDASVVSARKDFRQALLNARGTRTNIGEVEAAAARFCQALRVAGHSPQGMLIDAKQVIEETIDGDNVQMAERAITSCIQHYFRPDDGPSL